MYIPFRVQATTETFNAILDVVPRHARVTDEDHWKRFIEGSVSNISLNALVQALGDLACIRVQGLDGSWSDFHGTPTAVQRLTQWGLHHYNTLTTEPLLGNAPAARPAPQHS